eukprot:s335_g9.t1
MVNQEDGRLQTVPERPEVPELESCVLDVDDHASDLRQGAAMQDAIASPTGTETTEVKRFSKNRMSGISRMSPKMAGAGPRGVGGEVNSDSY